LADLLEAAHVKEANDVNSEQGAGWTSKKGLELRVPVDQESLVLLKRRIVPSDRRRPTRRRQGFDLHHVVQVLWSVVHDKGNLIALRQQTILARSRWRREDDG